MFFAITMLAGCGKSSESQNSASSDAASTQISAGTVVRTPDPVDIPVVEVVPAKNVDERLFLMSLLEELYLDLPRNASDLDGLQKDLDALRNRAELVKQHIQAKQPDDALASLYEDYLSEIDDYRTFLSDVGKINRDTEIRASQDMANVQDALGAVGAGVDVGSFAHDNGASDSNSILLGTAVTFFGSLLQQYNKEQARDSDQQAAINASSQEFKNKFSTYMARAQNAALDMEQKYAWNRGEAGFDETPEQDDAMTNYISSNNLDGLLLIMESEQKRRPRDPFLLAEMAFYYSFKSDRTPTELLRYANECVTAASLVPADPIYDKYRGRFLYMASDIANRAANVEIGRKSWATAFSHTAAYAVGLWNACLKFTPNDTTGELRERKAWVLMQSGHLNEALALAIALTPLEKNNVRYAYNLACLYSALNDTDDSFTSFEHAVRDLDFNSISLAKNDPDLQAMRAAQKQRFDELTAFSWSANITPGAILDDVNVTNKSAFSITNVTVNATLSYDGNPKVLTLKVDKIDSGKTHTWSNVASHGFFSNAERPKSKMSLSADQSE